MAPRGLRTADVGHYEVAVAWSPPSKVVAVYGQAGDAKTSLMGHLTSSDRTKKKLTAAAIIVKKPAKIRR
jgi:hypothetical protein